MKFSASIALILLMISTAAFGQDVVPTHREFASKTIRDEFRTSFDLKDLPGSGSAGIVYNENDSLNAFVSYLLYEYLSESGYECKFIPPDREVGDGLIFRIMNPKIKLEVGKSDRYIDGSFGLMFYISNQNRIADGMETKFTFNGSDEFPAVEANRLTKNTPGFLMKRQAKQFSGNQLGKVLTIGVAGIVTYLFYSVRS